MKTIEKLFYSAVVISAILSQTSCTSESPFISSGEGKVFIATEMYDDWKLSTRALNEDAKQSLEDNMTIYISKYNSNKKEVIRNYTGVKNVESPIVLKSGPYAIDGWTGDSVPASYDQKYYRGTQLFTVEDGENSQVKFEVNIANVIVAVDTENLDPSVQDYKVTFNHSRAGLDLDKEKIEEGKKIYFMMPNADTSLHYKVEVTGADGNPVTEEGDIPNVQRAHQYTLNLLSEQPVNDKGGALIRIEILDIPIHDKTMFVYPAPAFKAELGGESFDAVENQIDCTEGNFRDFNLRVVSYYGLNSLVLNFDSEFEDMEAVNGTNIWNNGVYASGAISKLESIGIKYEHLKDESVSDDNGSVTVHEGWLRFSNDFFRKLKNNEKEYTIEISASDGRAVPISNSIKLRIANNLKAVDNKLVASVETPNAQTQPMAILSTTATLEGILNSDEATDYGFMYRLNGTSDSYMKAPAQASSRAIGDKFSVTLTNLQPGKTYEYRAYCGDYMEQKSRLFTTESKFDIPFGNMESWSTFSDRAAFPGTGNASTFWDSGNHGSQMAYQNLTEGDDSFISGNKVAKLQSKSVMTVLAAGNLFVGTYVNNVGTKGAKVNFGRPYDGSHPSALKVKVNYRPGANPSVKSGKESNVPENFKEGNDHGQIYVALSTKIAELNTAEDIMFDPKADYILAYGEKTWSDNVGPDGGLDEITIPFEYYEKAKTTPAAYLIIVCSASKYGDYFSGSSKSVMYLDDFELEYDDIQWAK